MSIRRPGFDLTFSAPKSVSVLFGIGDDALRVKVQAAHDRSVREALGYMERHAAVTRRGAGGADLIAGNGFVAAAFRHRTSRAGDPQLHTHVLVANLTLGEDGRWSTLDGRRIYAHAKTAGFLYEARLRALLTRELGVAWGPVRNGIADVDGVPKNVLQAFSRRRADIEAELQRRGTSGAVAAQVATLATRRGKDYRVAPEQLAPEWRERAGRLGLAAEDVRALVGRTRSDRLRPELVEEIARRLAGPLGLTRRRSTFTRRNVVQALCELLPPAAGLAVGDVERLADMFLRSEHVVVLASGTARSAVMRRQDGRLVATVADERVFSTPELLARERAIIDRAVGSRDGGFGLASHGAVQRAIMRRPTITAEQSMMVRRLTRDGDGVAVVVGEAGTGKTYALAAAKEAWKASRHTVIGAALAQRAARELQGGSGIESETIAALLTRLRRGPTTLPNRAVLVVDEAGMVSTRELAQLLEHAARADAKVVLVGDYRQLAEIDAGGTFRALTTRLPAIELKHNQRQAAAWERDALSLLRNGDAQEALRRYHGHGRVLTGGNADSVRQRLVADWWASPARDKAVMIAFRRVDVAELNGRARALMRASGALGDTELVLDGRPFAAGDRVQLRHNDRRLGVANGDRGVITAVDASREVLEVDVSDRSVRLDLAYLRDSNTRRGPALAHGYAITGHSAQGLTCDEAFVLVTGDASREWLYTALSRGRNANRLYAIASESDDRSEIAPTSERPPNSRDALAGAVRRSSAQTIATDARPRTDAGAALDRAVRARQVAEGELARATRERAWLEAHKPGPLRWRMRERHAQALADAYRRERSWEQTLDERRRLEREQLKTKRERTAAYEPRRERPTRRRARDRGWEIGR